MTRILLSALGGAVCGALGVYALLPDPAPLAPPTTDEAADIDAFARTPGARAAPRTAAPATAERLALYEALAGAGESELALGEGSSTQRLGTLREVLMWAARAESTQVEAVADRLVALPDRDLQALSMLMDHWAQNDAGAALGWMVSKATRIPPEAFGSAAVQIASADPARAALHTARIPQEARPQWISAVARAYAQNDPQQAIQWAEQFRGEPEERDGALAALLSAAALRDDDVDSRVLSAFSSDARRQQAMVDVVAQLALRRPEAARAMLDEHVSDPALHARAEALLERSAEISGQSIVDAIRVPADFVLQAPIVAR